MEKMDCKITNVTQDSSGDYVISYTYIDTVDGGFYKSREYYQTANAKQAKIQFNKDFPR